jgi:hypothetical protein
MNYARRIKTRTKTTTLASLQLAGSTVMLNKVELSHTNIHKYHAKIVVDASVSR